MSHINLNFGAWVRVARTLASSASLRIQYVPKEEIEKMGAQAWTDGVVLYLRKPSHHWTEEQFDLWLYYLLHEIGHNRESRRGVFGVLRDKDLQPHSLLAYVSNILEDHVQEYSFCKAEPVVRGKLQAGRVAYMEFILSSRGEKQVKMMRESPEAPTLFAWDAMLREAFMPGLQGYSYLMRKPVDDMPEVKAWTEALMTGGYIEELATEPSPLATFELAERIVDEVFKRDSQQQQGVPGKGANGEGNGNGAGEGQEQKGEGEQGNNEGEAESGDASGSSAAGKSEVGEGEGKPAEGGGTVDYTDLMMHDHSKDKRSGGGGGGAVENTGINIDYDRYFAEGKRYGEFVPRLADAKVLDMTKPGAVIDDDMRHRNPEPQASSLSKRVGRLLQAVTRNRRVEGQKSGKLSNKNLHRLKMKEAGELRKRVFHKRVINKDKDVAVTIGVDCSGSMSRAGKASGAVAAVTHLHEVISKQLRIPVEILGYSETAVGHRGNYIGHHFIMQSFDKVQTTEKVTESIRSIMPRNGCNRDGEFMLWARDRLLRKKAGRHILIMLSDGQPKSSGGSDVAGFTKDVINKIQDEGRVEVYAIGIMTDTVHSFYKHCRVINESSQLEAALLNVLKDKIINHH